MNIDLIHWIMTREHLARTRVGMIRHIVTASPGANYEAVVFVNPHEVLEAHILGILARVLIVFHPEA